jgi:hypothetical protein
MAGLRRVGFVLDGTTWTLGDVGRLPHVKKRVYAVRIPIVPT